jgi:hypothetical protein
MLDPNALDLAVMSNQSAGHAGPKRLVSGGHVESKQLGFWRGLAVIPDPRTLGLAAMLDPSALGLAAAIIDPSDLGLVAIPEQNGIHTKLLQCSGRTN